MTAKARIRAIDRFVKGCKEDGIYDDLNAACVMAGWDSLAGALTPLKGAAPTNNGLSVYDRGIGIAGDGSSAYLDSNRNNTADPQNDNHNAVFVSSPPTSASVYIAAGSSGGQQNGSNNLGVTDGVFCRNRSGIPLVSLGSASADGLVAVSRSSAAAITTRISGESTTSSLASQSPLSEEVTVFARRSGASVDFYSDATIPFFSIGSATDLAALDARVSTLMADLRAIEETGFDKDAIAYLRAVEEADGAFLETDVKVAINSLVAGLKADKLWESMKACCLLCGPRTLAGALVPLRGVYGPELVDIDNLPAPTTSVSTGGIPSYDAASRTMSCEVGSNNSFPRFFFDLGLTPGKRYRVRGRLSGDYTSLYGNGVRTSISSYASIAADGTFDKVVSSGTFDGKTGNISFLFNSLSTPKSVTIEELSIQEDSFTPTAEGGWASGDYDRSTGMKGDGTSLYLNTNYQVPESDLNDTHIACHVTLAATNAVHYKMGAYATTPAQNITAFRGIGSGNLAIYNNSLAGADAGSGRGNVTNFHGQSRSDSSSVTARVSNTSHSLSFPSTTVVPMPLFLFATNLNNSGKFGGFDGRIAFYSAGTALDLAKLDSHVSSYVTAIGAAI